MTGTLGSHPGIQRWMTTLDGRRLQQLRRQHGLSQEQLATHAGISLSTMRRLERQATASCRGRTLGRLAASLRTEPAHLTPATDDDAIETDIATDDLDVERSPNDITAHEDSREASE